MNLNVVYNIKRHYKNTKLFFKLKIRNCLRKIQYSLKNGSALFEKLYNNSVDNFINKITNNANNTNNDNNPNPNSLHLKNMNADNRNIKNIIYAYSKFIKEKFMATLERNKKKWKKDNIKELIAEIKTGPLLSKVNLKHPMIIMLLSTVLFFAGIFAYIHIKSMKMNKMLQSGAEPPIAVSTIQAEYQNWQPKFKAPGSLRAIQGIDVTTEVAGMIRSIELRPGSEVNAGDVLVQLNADAEIAELHALEAQAELAKITYERDKLQYEIKAISKETLDTALADLNSKNALVAQQAATLAKKTIRAPFKGRLGISTMNLGQYLNAGDKVVTLQTFDPIYFDFFVPQQIISKITVDQLVTITSDALSGEVIHGKVTTIDPKADPQTRNVQVEATIINTGNKLLPGMFAEVEVNTGSEERFLTLPQSAISFNSYGELIYLVNEKNKNKDKDGKAVLFVKQAFVKVGSSRGDQVSVLTGLKEGDIVVTSGQNKLKNGSIVFINNSILPLNKEAPNVVNQ